MSNGYYITQEEICKDYNELLDKYKEAKQLLKEASGVLILCSLIDKSTMSKDMSDKIDEFLKEK